MPVDKNRKSSKLRQLYYGPYKILKQLSPWRVLVDDQRVLVVSCKEQEGGPGLPT
jgi:hypothetical protein